MGNLLRKVIYLRYIGGMMIGYGFVGVSAADKLSPLYPLRSALVPFGAAGATLTLYAGIGVVVIGVAVRIGKRVVDEASRGLRHQ